MKWKPYVYKILTDLHVIPRRVWAAQCKKGLPVCSATAFRGCVGVRVYYLCRVCIICVLRVYYLAVACVSGMYCEYPETF